MPVVELNSVFVKAASCPIGQRKIDFFDARQKGFLIEVRCSGRKTYYQRYSEERGRERQFKIGPADVLTFEQARRKGRSVLARAFLGENPQARRQEIRAIPTLNCFATDSYLPFVRTYKRSWHTDETVLRLHVLPSLGGFALDEVNADRIVALIGAMRLKGYATGTSNRVLVILRYLYNLALRWKVPGLAHNPTTGIELSPEVQRNRFLSKEEAQGLVAALAADENRVAANAILLLLLTGGRRNEITQARWEHVIWSERKLLVPLSKSGKPRWISLSSSAMELLNALPRSGEGIHIFPSPVTGRPCASLWFPWRRIRARAGLDDMRLHDLRHSFASFLVNEGVSLYVVQTLLGHANARTTQRYAHLIADTLSQATDIVDGVLGRASAADIMRGARLESSGLGAPVFDPL
jgi:integrase